MAVMAELKTYEDVLVSGVSFDFEGRAYGEVPRAVSRDWVALVVKVAGVVQPQVSSYIQKGARSPRARIYVFHGADKAAAVEAVIAGHSAECARATRGVPRG